MKKEYTRITTILSDLSGIHRIPKYILDEAAERGSRVHQAIEDTLHGFGGPMDSDIQGYLNSFQHILDAGLPSNKVDIEKRLYNEDMMLTGCLDAVFHTPTGCVVFDWKTSKREYPSFRLQAAAYRWLLEQEHKVNSVIFWQLMTDGAKPKMYNYDDTYVEDLNMFMKCVDIYRYFQQMEKKHEDIR